jgi:uncharacterized membrane protein YcaP (DUF421 family)
VLILVLLHRLVAFISFRNKKARTFINGNEIKVLKDGEFIENGLREALVTKEEVFQAIRINGQIKDLKDVEESYIEPSGEISIIKKKK